MNKMDLFDDMETTQEAVVETVKQNSSEPQTVEFSEELREMVLSGAGSAKEEAERPFWNFSDEPYPYEHFTPAYLVSFGEKGSGKSTSALSVSGNVLAITLEKRGNLTRPWARLFNYNPRIQIFGFSEYIERTAKGNFRDTSNEVYLQIVNLLKRASELERKFDWVIIDGLQALNKVAEQRMRALNNQGAFVKFNNLSLWGERSMYFENVGLQLPTHVASKGVYLTSQNVLQRAAFLTADQKAQGMTDEDIPVKEPKWKDKIKDDIDAVIYHEIKENQSKSGSKMVYKALVSTNKLGSTGSHDLTLSKDNPESTKNFIASVLTEDSEFIIP